MRKLFLLFLAPLLLAAQGFTVSPSDFQTSYFVGRNSAGTVTYLYQINPAYCLSDAEAMALAADLKDLSPVVVRIAPLGSNWGGLYVQGNLASPDNTVAWLQFKGASGNPVLFNAGVLANNFIRGYEPTYAESLTRTQILQAIATN